MNPCATKAETLELVARCTTTRRGRAPMGGVGGGLARVLPDDEERTTLALVVHTTEVLADDPQTGQLHSAEHENRDEQGCIAGHGHAVEEAREHDHDAV